MRLLRSLPLFAVVPLALLLAADSGPAAGLASAAPRAGEREDPHARPAPKSDAPHGSADAKAPAAADAHAAPAAALDPDALWEQLLEGNFRFQADAPRRREYSGRRAELAQSQHPPVMVLTCADSRVSPELVFDQSLGDLFVVRTAGNVADPIALGSLEYVAEHLGCRLLVVMGHERCGAVKAAASGDKLPSANLEAIVAQILPAFERVEPGDYSAEDLLELRVEANVRQSSLDLLDQSPILLEKIAAGELSIVRCVYDLDRGDVKRLY